MLFSLRMAVLLHKWEFKNTEVEFLKVSENIWSQGQNSRYWSKEVLGLPDFDS